MLKKAKYPNWGWPAVGPEFGVVVYTIIEDYGCIFCGVTPPNKATSTINAAESIISTIAQQEGVSVVELRFFDLQTKSQYGNIPPGTYQFDELRILVTADQKVIKTWWVPYDCPDEVLEIFKDQIGQSETPLVVLTSEEARKQGYYPTDQHSSHIQHLYGRIGASRSTLSTRREVVVDNQTAPELMAIVGVRYTVWERRSIQDN